MKVDQFTINGPHLDYSVKRIDKAASAQLILLYTSRKQLENPVWLGLLRSVYPNANIMSCTTSGEIYESELLDDSISAVAISLEHSSIKVASINLKEVENSYEAGKKLVTQFSSSNLQHVLVSCDGWLVDGSELIEGMYKDLSSNVTISGGMAGDGANFSHTLVGLNHKIEQGNIVAAAFYGNKLKVGYGNHGGWDVYGPRMLVTKCNGRIIEEINHKAALPLYKTYIGSDSEGLPGTALKYPLGLIKKGKTTPLVRTIFNVDEINQTIITGSKIAVGSEICFIRAEFDNIIKGVEQAAESAVSLTDGPVELALIVSCIGRKLLFGQDIQEEIEICKKKLGRQTPVIGYYSNGEISTTDRKYAELHHQMVTITTFSESE